MRVAAVCVMASLLLLGAGCSDTVPSVDAKSVEKYSHDVSAGVEEAKRKAEKAQADIQAILHLIQTVQSTLDQLRQ